MYLYTPSPSLQGSLSTLLLLPALPSLLLVCHATFRDSDQAMATSCSSYSLSPAPHLLHSFSCSTLTHHHLHPDKRRLLLQPLQGGCPQFLDLPSGSLLASLPLHSTFPLHQLGFLSPSTIFLLHQATYLTSSTLIITDLQGSLKNKITLASCSSPLLPAYSLLLSPGSPSSLLLAEQEQETLLPWPLPSLLPSSLRADPASLIGCEGGRQKGQLVVLDFV